MAPEIVHSRSVYTKSVDLWATGIIMHMVLTGGSHPLTLSDRNKSEGNIKDKLLALHANVDGSPLLTKLAQSLFRNLAKLQAS